MQCNLQQEFYKDANAALVVYDLIRLKDTLPNALKWKARVDSFVCKRPGESIPMFLLGNKVYIYIHACVQSCSYGFAIIISFCMLV